MSQITILFSYLIAALAFALSRFPQHSERAKTLVLVAVFLSILGIVVHDKQLGAFRAHADWLNSDRS